MVVQKSSSNVNEAAIKTTMTASGGTTITELNVSNTPYLYYMMTSGQYSPCETLASGTGSDLESQQTQSSHHIRNINSHKDTIGASIVTDVPKLELHLKTTKLCVNDTHYTLPSSVSASTNINSNANVTATVNTNGSAKMLLKINKQAYSLTDGEESVSSSLSCDSLHFNDNANHPHSHQSHNHRSHTHNYATKDPVPGILLPDSLLRDIRDRKIEKRDFAGKSLVCNGNSISHSSSSSNGNSSSENNAHVNADSSDEEEEEGGAAYESINRAEPDSIELTQSLEQATSAEDLHSIRPINTFIFNQKNRDFVDMKMNSVPCKYEADKYYDFHVNENDDFSSYSSTVDLTGADGLSFNTLDYDAKNINLPDDAFAGYKDIRFGSNTSTIRSSKGTVRGIKNRVRNGIATFLLMQQANVKNYKEKDLGKVVLYTTSMGIIRETYAKCATVKQILRTLLIKFEERDVFMSIGYQQEIKERMHSETIRVPQLFVEGQHIGDADTVERLNETGELRKLLKPYKSITTTDTCQVCGGYRLLPCASCNGSKKSVHRNHFTAEFVALKCMSCDEVGLVKCHNC